MIQDSLGRTYNETKPTESDLLRSGKPQPFVHPQAEKFETKDALAQAIEPLRDELGEYFKDEYDNDKDFTDQIVKKLEEIRTHVALPRESSNTFKNMQSGETVDYSRSFATMQKSLDSSHGLNKQFVEKACHPGSIYTHDIYIVQQMYRTNKFLNDLVSLQKESMGKKTSTGDIQYNKAGDTFVSTDISHGEMSRELDKEILSRIHELTGISSPPTMTPSHTPGMPGPDDNQKPAKATSTPQTGLDSYASYHRKSDVEHLIDALRHDTRREINRLLIRGSSAMLGGKPIASMAESVSSHIDYQQSIQELAYQTERITKNMSRSQTEFAARDQLTQSARIGGKSLEEMQKLYVRNLSVGYKSQKDTLRVTRASATLSTMIGSDTESTNSTFNELYMTLNASAATMEDISRSIQRTAVNSKLTGEGLVRAVSAAKPLLDSLRSQGKLTAKTSATTIGLTAEAQKRGLEGQFEPIFAAMTGGFSKAEFGVQSLLANLATASGNMKLFEKLSMDGVLNKEEIKQLGGNADAVIKGLTGGRANAGNVKELMQNDPMFSKQMNDIMGQMGAKGIDDLLQFSEVLNTVGKSLSDSLGDLDKKLSVGNLTRREKNDLFDQKKSLVQDSRLSVATSMDEFSKFARPGESISGLMERSKGTKPYMEIAADLKELAAGGQLAGFKEADIGSPESIMKALSQNYMQTIQRTNDQLRDNTNLADNSLIVNDPSKMVAEAMKDPSGTGMRELLESMGKAQQAASKRDLKEVDPMIAAKDTLNDINVTVSHYSSKALGLLTGILGEVGIIAVSLGAWASSLTIGLGGMDSIKRILGMKAGARGAAGAGAVADVADNVSDVLESSFAKKILPKFAESLHGVLSGTFGGLKKSIGLVADAGIKTTSKVAELVGLGDIKDSVVDMGKKVVENKGAIKDYVVAGATMAVSKSGEAWRNVISNPRFASVAAKGQTVGKALSGKMNLGEAVFRAAEAQEKIPIWGKFAKMFGAGDEIAAKAGELAARPGGFGKFLPIPSTATMGAGAGAAEIGSVASKAALPLMVFLTGMESVGQALETAANAEKIFSKNTSDITPTMRMAAESAGFLTGILNSLSFGVLGSWLGSDGDLTAYLAEFFHWIPLLGYAIQALMIPFKIIYGIVWGLWEAVKEVGKGIMDGLYEIAKPFIEVFDYLKTTVGNLMGELSVVLQPLEEGFKALFGEGAGTASIIGVLTGILKGLGTAIGWVLKEFGVVVGFILRLVLPAVKVLIDVLAALVSTIIKFVAPFVEALGRVLKGVGSIIQGIVNIFKGIFTLDFETFKSGIGSVVGGVFTILSGIAEGVISYFVGLPLLIPSLLANVVGAIFTGLANWGKSVGALFGPVGEAIMSFIVYPFTFLGDVFSGIGAGFSTLNKIISLLTSLDISGMWNGLKDYFGAIFFSLKPILTTVKTIFALVFKFFKGIGNLVSALWDSLTAGMSGIWQTLKNGLKFTFGNFTSWVGGGLSGVPGAISYAFGGVGSLIAQGLAPVGNMIYNTFTQAWDGVIGYIRNSWVGKMLGWADESKEEKAAKLVANKASSQVGTVAQLDTRLATEKMTDAQRDMLVQQKQQAQKAIMGKPFEQKIAGMQAELASPERLAKLRSDNTVGWGDWIGQHGEESRQQRLVQNTSDYNKKYGLNITPSQMEKIIQTGTMDAYTSSPISKMDREMTKKWSEAPSLQTPSAPIPGVKVDVPVARINKAIEANYTSKTAKAGDNLTNLKSSAVDGSNVVQSYASAVDATTARQTEANKTSIQPLPISDIHDRMQQEFASSEPINANISSKELTDMVVYAEREVTELQEMKSLLRDLVKAMQPVQISSLSGSSGAGTGDTRSKTKGPAATQYYSLSFGRFGDTANKGAVNDGVV